MFARSTIATLGLALLIAVGALGPAVAAPGPGTAVPSRSDTATADYCADAEELAFLKLINDYRAQNGLGPLALTQTLGAASDHHSVSMADHNYFSHNVVPEGITWSQNVTNHGYTYNTYRGENIAAGNATASGSFTQWKNSPSHNANMLNANYKAVGVGRAYNAGSTYKWYWTTDFGGYVDGAAKTCAAAAPAPTPTAAAPAAGAPYPIVASGRSSNSNPGTNAYDGNAGTSWHTTATSPPTAAFVWFDLGATKRISSIRWMWQRTGSADRVRIQVSTDRVTWTTLATVANAPVGAWQTLPAGVSARFVRFYFTNPNADPVLGYLAEVQVTA